MAILTANGTVDATCGRNGTSTDEAKNWTSYGKSSVTIGVAYTGSINVALVKFTTPDFTGECTNLYIKLPIIKGSASTAPTSYSMYFAIASSDANKASYAVTKRVDSSVDAYQLANGTVSVTGLTASLSENTCAKMSINASSSNKISSIKPKTTYYLYLWPTDATSNKVVQNWWSTAYQSVVVTYKTHSNGVIIPNSSGTLEKYELYIGDSNGVTVPYDIYVYDSTLGMIECVTD